VDLAELKEKPDIRLTIEIVSGSDFKLESSKYTPYIEVSQDIEQLPEKEKALVKHFESNKAGSADKNLVTTRVSTYCHDGEILEQLDEVYHTKIIHSTPVPCRPNDKGIYTWSKCVKLIYNPELKETGRYFAVNLYKTKKHKRKSKKFGKPKTFNLVHLRDQKVNDIALDFRETFQSPSEGKVMLRIQYIHNEKTLYKR
jgi:hypothetical protein